MIHPNTELRFINESIGYGVFATSDIPEGTIVYVKDSLELVISPTDYLLHTSEMQEVVEKYSYIDEKGNRIISWDFAKYVNHCCNCNTISTGYGFEIAIREIKKGEQITDEYGIFNLDYPMTLVCGEPGCRKVIKPEDFDNYYEQWDHKIRQSIDHLFVVEQPLMPFVEKEIREQLDEFFQNPESYRSVYSLRLKK
ncbi:SET domain-containing protein [Lewinella cohaerens]|uniref:SET domain-containing protein n=1 Tax=Lewinella cohaerens TaxID=70995 RepID=UPI00035DB0FA|nr:SET domain-containing protein [Lewinella cohaerens]